MLGIDREEENVNRFQKHIKLEGSTLSGIQIKSSHNSYSHGNYTKQLKFNNTYPWKGGCLSIEIDLIQNPSITGVEQEWDFWSAHSLQKDMSQFQSFSRILSDLHFWSQQNQRHFPIIVYLDFKEESIAQIKNDPVFLLNYETYVEKINQIIEKYIDNDKIYRNSDFLLERSQQNIYSNERKFLGKMRKFSSIYEALSQQGWPQVKELRGKFLFVVSGSDRQYNKKTKKLQNIWKLRNEFSNIEKNYLSFVDIDGRSVQNLEVYLNQNPNRVIYNYEIEGYEDKIKTGIKVAKKHNLLTRAYFVNRKHLWNKSLYCYQANIIVTDKIYEDKWAMFPGN